MQSIQITHCNKSQRVTIFKIPSLSQSKGYYLDDWKQMIWQGGIKVTQKNKILKVLFIQKNGKIFAQTEIPTNYKQAIVKTSDSSRGYAVRLKKPTGGFLWVGVAFRDRNDAFDFGVVFQQYAHRNQLSSNPNALQQQFAKSIDFSLKKGQKIVINVNNNNNKKGQNTNADFFNDFTFDDNKQTKKQQKKKTNNNNNNFGQVDWFSDFGNNTNTNTKKQQQKKQSKNNDNLIDF